MNVTAQPEINSAIVNYLTENMDKYNIVSSAASADYKINIGYNIGDVSKGCSYGNVYGTSKPETEPHTGMIFVSGTDINVCGSRGEGLVNAVRRLNKEDLIKDRLTLFDKYDIAAIATRDFFGSREISYDSVYDALNGGLELTEDYVETPSGVALRLKHYKPILSQTFLDWLFNVDLNVPLMDPVVMAGGLWSDIDSWKEAGKEIS